MEDSRARVSPKGDTKPACEPRYNKGGAIAVVKSTESLNSWYRLASSSSSCSFPRFDRSLVLLSLVCAHEIIRSAAEREREREKERERSRSPSSRPRRTRRLRDVHSRVHVSFSRQSGALLSLSLSLSVSFSLSLALSGERVYLHGIPLGRTKPAETRWRGTNLN